jgi:hypothetical protein
MIEKANGKNQNIGGGDGTNVQTRKDAGTEAGLSERQAKQSALPTSRQMTG